MSSGQRVDRVIVIARHPEAVARLLPAFTSADISIEAWSAPGSRLGYSRHLKSYGTLSDDAAVRARQLAAISMGLTPHDWVVVGSDPDLLDVLAASAIEPVVGDLLPVADVHRACVGSKVGTAELLQQLTIDQPGWAVAESADEVAHAASALGFPVIVKADRSGGGQGTAMMTEPAGLATSVAAHPGPFLVEQHVAGPTVSIDIVVIDGRVAVAPYSRMRRTFGPHGISIEREYGPLPAGRLAADLDRLAGGLGGSWFGNVSAIRRDDGSHAIFEVDLRPNVWHAYLQRLGYPLVPALQRLHDGLGPRDAVAPKVETTRIVNVTRAAKHAIMGAPRSAALLLDYPNAWHFAQRGDARLTYREARDFTRWLLLTRGGRRRPD